MNEREDDLYQDSDEIDIMNHPIGKRVLELLLDKNGYELKDLLENFTLLGFIGRRVDLYLDELKSYDRDYQAGNTGWDGMIELADATAFKGLS